MMKPQHSKGNSRSACAIMASMLARRIDAVLIVLTLPVARSSDNAGACGRAIARSRK
jgi:hypothetical protein